MSTSLSLHPRNTQCARPGPCWQNFSADALVRRDLVPICVIQDTVLFLNGRCAALLGREERDLPEGVPLREIVAEADWPRVARSLRRTPAMKPGSGVSIMFSAVRVDGSIVDLELIGTAVAERGETYVVAVVNDITARVRDDARLNYLAFSDGLTGLANRTLFLDRLHQSLLASRRTEDRFALLACDLDGFKAVNDTYGHEAGDRVLQVIADMLRSCCREVDTAARTGGDEFALILPGIADPYDAALVANRVIAALADPISIDGVACSVGISVGIAIYPRDGETIETLVHAADAAMYASKAAGRNRSSFAGPGRHRGQAVGRQPRHLEQRAQGGDRHARRATPDARRQGGEGRRGIRGRSGRAENAGLAGGARRARPSAFRRGRGVDGSLPHRGSCDAQAGPSPVAAGCPQSRRSFARVEHVDDGGSAARVAASPRRFGRPRARQATAGQRVCRGRA